MKKFKTIDVALYIFILTGLGYFVTFLYGWGYNTYFSIPIYFIDFSIFNIARSIALLGVGVSLILTVYIFFLDKTDINMSVSKFINKVFKPKYTFFYQFLCLAGLIIIFILYMKDVNTSFGIFYLWASFVILLLYFCIKKYFKAFVAVSIVLLLMLTYLIGVVNASNQTEFHIIDSYEDYLIVTFSNDKVIAVKYEPKTNTIFPEFKIQSIANLEELNEGLKLIEIEKPMIAEPQKVN